MFINLAKAFNTFEHDILIRILKYFGVSYDGLSQGIVYLSYKTEILIIKFPIMAFPAKSWVISPYFMRAEASWGIFFAINTDDNMETTQLQFDSKDFLGL